MPSGSTHGPTEIGPFRREVQEFLGSSIDADMRAAAARQIGLYSEPAIVRKWHRLLYERGWITPMWPVEFGGAGWSNEQRYVFEQEAALHEAPSLPAAGLSMCGPILIAFGTPEQQQRFLPRLRSGDDYWCQGYSEPDSGSDLASLKCRAVRDGDDYVVTGTKIWTTYAQHADWIFMLVRTDQADKPQRGISFLLADLTSPGITIQPIISMSGEHEVNQVFFDNVRVPVCNRVGAENEGWSVAKRLLEFERSVIYGPRIRRILARAERVARETGEVWASLDFRRRFAEACIAADVLEAGELRLLSQAGAADAKKTSSILKLAGTEALQRATELALYASGTDAAYLAGSQGLSSAAFEGSVSMARYLNSRAATIYGGSSEVQRNILAKTALDL